jgi:aminobenzoyl-glutamate utilization protein B
MKKYILLLLTACLSTAQAQEKISVPANKQSILNSIAQHEKSLITLSDQIWGFAEIAMRKHHSAKLLADYAEQKGFRVTRNVADIPTAFIAEFGSGKPIIGILGEFDALPGLSQKAAPTKEVLNPGAAGHGCGHNMFGAASLGGSKRSNHGCH